MKYNPAKEIAKLQRKIAAIEAKAATAAAKKLQSDQQAVTALAKKLGYKTPGKLFAALFGKAPKPAVAAAKAPVGKKRKRARLDESDRKAIVADLKSGEFSAAQVAKKHGVSVPTVNNIKKAAGLTKSRKAGKKPAAKKPAKKNPAPAPAPAA